MTSILLSIRAVLLAAALVAAAPAIHAAEAPPKAGDACFKRVYDKTASTGR